MAHPDYPWKFEFEGIAYNISIMGAESEAALNARKVREWREAGLLRRLLCLTGQILKPLFEIGKHNRELKRKYESVSEPGRVGRW